MRKFTGTVRFFVPYYCEVSATAKTKAAAEKKMVKTIKAEIGRAHV